VPAHPKLMMRVIRDPAAPQVFAVAYDIEDLQFEYLIDLGKDAGTPAPDHVLILHLIESVTIQAIQEDPAILDIQHKKTWLESLECVWDL